ncbi:hypothetical protein GPAL_1355 [Glaciecola pallidula DSM 14239 = ACAM 615]|jgi:putative glutathione S-transferase|uniref:Glutathione S-transferase n=1 Tax=Brumicola pallidula DSM 14239 = ACAM 615 TaxID=1121922 RepID=K6ZH35_9ALTE|nr:hypothetical protein GPAL_1355 [Glaciecola pallidula DSM 14239 = ACAM 615]
MGFLVNGVWQDQWYDTKKSNGKFVRQDSAFKNTISNRQGLNLRLNQVAIICL